jgi:hypothetical protein
MKTFTQLTMASALLFTSVGQTNETLPPWLDMSGSINFDVIGKDSNDFSRDLRVQDVELRFEILAKKGIKLVIKAELERVLNKYINDEDLSTKIEQMLEEAYIEIETDKISGLPRAVITVGKQRMAFGRQIAELPQFRDSLLYQLQNEEEMIGLTVTLSPKFFNIVDEVAVSLYETGAGDFKISNDKAVSVQLSKKLTQQLEMQIAALMKQHGQLPEEKRARVGFVFTSEDGRVKVWADGLVMQDNPTYQDARYAGTIGASMKLGRGAIVIEASTLQKVAKELAVAYNMPVGAHLVLSPEVRLTEKENGDRDTVIGIRARLEFGKKSGRRAGPRA